MLTILEIITFACYVTIQILVMMPKQKCIWTRSYRLKCKGKVLSMEEADRSGRKYYQFDLKPRHVLITAAAAGNRLNLFGVTASGKKHNHHSFFKQRNIFSSP